MARIAGVNIPTNKRVIVALTYIHGIGPTTARKIADKLGIDHSRRVQDLTDGGRGCRPGHRERRRRDVPDARLEPG